MITWPANVTPSSVYDTYWQFAAERQNVFVKRAAGLPAPWTDDPILNEFKFTCPYRACDRTSQYLLRNVIYDDGYESRSVESTFFRILLYKIFNKMETWDLLTEKLGAIEWERPNLLDAIDKTLVDAMKGGGVIFSGAYLMCGKLSKYEPKSTTFLKILKDWMDTGVPGRVARAKSMKEVFDMLHRTLISDFLAYQFVTDLNYSTICDFDENSFTAVGWGSRRGIEKIIDWQVPRKDPPYNDIIRVLTENQDAEFARLGLKFQRIGNRPLQLIDCQNVLCETDKYLRRARPDISTKTIPRTRMKKRFAANPVKIEYFYPPKWGIN